MACPHPYGFHTEVREQYATAGAEVTRLVQSVTEEQWAAPTPCRDWDVRNLVNHLAAQHLWVCQAVAGYAPEQIGRRFEGDVLGRNPLGVWTMAVDTAVRAINQPGALDLLVHVPYGMRDVGGYARELTAETVVHSWDLARALGERGPMPPGAARYALAEFRNYRNLAGTGRFDPPRTTPPGADAQELLLAFTGRDPQWSAERLR
ncbi:TIGR03086 family metal-binding protein [Kitasatospora sp. A2-31]|uniref:TIGR03086 family metal-binding protein n=1 Tax=Kitasatospora sp. A2-31 TaxID=2916414 RepID=UPI001EEAC42F|nr:TIGR03086 family metal-binding protein [Kitasatospora sp. A2-31]MCG6498342.1 TIGR03086 family metal-binding protein [Kitasatospora sp. A2-31]